MSKVQRPVTAEDAALERITREKARRQLMSFATYMFPNYSRTKHLEILAERLEQVELYIRTKGKEGIGRLMVLVPPRTGKTELTSKIFPAWFLGRNPELRVILTAYGADLAQGSSRAVRNYVMDARYKAIFGNLSSAEEPVTLSEDSRSKANWDLAAPHRGGVDSAGVGGAITGKGAHLLIVDDPYKNRDEAESESYREKVESWWKSAAYTRLEDGAAVVIVHTRWHPDDLAGTLLKMSVTDPLADDYEVIFMPALALEEDDYPTNEKQYTDNLTKGLYIPFADLLGRMPGEALWTEKYNEKALEKTKINIGDFEFASLYQQLPRPMSGGFFDDNMWKIAAEEEMPTGLNWVRYVDLAMGEKVQSDWNTTLATAIDEKTGKTYYRDMLRVHDINSFLPELKSMMRSPKERGVLWGFETNGFQSLVFKEFVRDRELAHVAMMEIKVHDDKVTRARPIRTRALQGMVYLVDGAWVRAFIAEARDFPNGRHDDQIDTASGGLEMTAEVGGPLIAFVV